MQKYHPHICLFQPEIPQNTGSIGRLAAAIQSRLHLILPLGFSTDDRNLRRAGLDYWPFLDLEIHDHMDSLLQQFEPRQIAFFSKKATKPYTELKPEVELLIFGRETSGLPDEFWQRYQDRFYGIPMFHTSVRSINLANAVSVVAYHQLLVRRATYLSKEEHSP